MKLQANKGTTTLTLGDIDAKEFGIDTENGVIFDILRNKMYSNKIAAVAREIASNSRDANRENNNTTVPIEISVIEPNVLISSTDMQLCFQDKGVGITPDRMSNIFLKYGSSSKRSSNRQTGGFGLGAKTPFAYTDTFTVITVCDHEGKRLKYTYTASITDRKGHGAGEMIKFGEEETAEETGTAIIVPIKESDRYEFEKEVYKATCFWKVTPIYKNFRSLPWDFKTAHSGKGYCIIKDDNQRFSGSQGFLIIIDGIPYSVDFHVTGFNSFATNSGYILCMEYKNGELTISASREAVQYDRETKVKLLWRHRKIQNDLRAELQTMLTAAPNYPEACLLVNVLEGEVDNPKMKLWSATYKWLYDERPKYKDKPTVEKVAFKYVNLYRYDQQEYSKGSTVRGIKMNERKFDSTWTLPMYQMDSKKRHAGKNATLLDNGGFILMAPVELTLKTDDDVIKQKNLQAVYDKILTAQQMEIEEINSWGVTLNSYNAVKVKKLPKKEKDPTLTQIKFLNDVGVRVRVMGNNDFKDWESKTINFLRQEKTTEKSEKYIYFITDRLSGFNYGKENPILPTKVEDVKRKLAGMLLGLTCVVVAQDKAHYFKDAGMMTIAEAWEVIEKTPAYMVKIQAAADYSVYKAISIADAWTKIKLDGRVSSHTMTAISYQKRDSERFEFRAFSAGLSHLEIKTTVSIDGVAKELKDLLDLYPMLRYFVDNYSSYNTKSKHIRAINDYMDIIDSMSSKITSNEQNQENLLEKVA